MVLLLAIGAVWYFLPVILNPAAEPRATGCY